MEAGAERDALAMQLFGDSARELNPLIEAGSAAWREMGKEAQAMGTVFSDENIAKMGAFDDSMQRFSATGTALKNSIGLVMIPAFQPLIETATSAMGQVAVALQDGLEPDELPGILNGLLNMVTCTFGGGFVIIPLMRERFVKELQWIEEEEMLDLTAIAQSSPGSIAINASILVGYNVAGIPGALITVVGAALPPLVIISIISAFYQAFRSNKYVSMAMTGMLAGVAAVIFDVVINMAWPILKKKRLLPIAVMLAAFVATRFFSVNIILIILVCGVIGALDTLYLQKKEAEE